ncbi:MAG TPA: amidohydrolase family protein [Acidimicrobiia bacterium]|nr:amidohydrolase family protein [Acidimicrobiia bacterium]
MTGIVDLHVHYYTDAYLNAVENAASTDVYRREHDGRFVCNWRGGVALTVPQPHPGVAQRLEMMDEAGIETQVLSVPSPSTYFLPVSEADHLSRSVNEEFAQICRSNPGRFRALAALPLQDTDAALSCLEHALGELAMSGVMILTNVDGTPLDDARFDPFWEAANDRRLMVYVHPTVPDAPHLDDYALGIGIGFLSDTNLAVARLTFGGVFERYPQIRWIFSHLGGTLPFMLPRLDNYHRQFPECREKAPRPPTEYIRAQLFDTASSHRPAIRCAADTLGEGRLVFGSDYPHVPGGVNPFLEALDETGTQGEARDQILSGRARRLLAGEAV